MHTQNLPLSISSRHRRQPIWLFDLDNTLHHTSARIFPVIDRLMTEYLMTHLALEHDNANSLRIRYWHRYGATLLGLMRHHGTDPHHFLHHTHQFENLAQLVVCERGLGAMLRRLPGRKVVFSNGPQAYVEAVLSLMKIRLGFERVFGLERLKLRPKPQRRAFLHVLHALGVTAPRCILVEDMLENLRMAKSLGMRTVWISKERRKPSYVDVKLASIMHLPSAMSSLISI